LAVIMSDQGSWISLERAVAAVHASIGGSPGPVHQTLISVCAEDLVRARWTSHYSEAAPAIHKRVWIGADIDWANHRIVKADGNGMVGVDFSEDDLRAWATSRQPAAAPAPAPKRHARYLGDDRLVDEALSGIGTKWGNAHQAALALASQADGNATEASKVSRLETKISNRLETSQNTSKD
jgi:hypothetical protein